MSNASLTHRQNVGALNLQNSHYDANETHSLDIIGVDIEPIKEQIKIVARQITTVLLLGGTGTGKTKFASLIHHQSPRKNGPFIDVNCAAIPFDLFEAEIFGVTKGAYTGAVKDRTGYMDKADGGTLLLDDIDTLSIYHQAKLLKVIESKSYFTVGGEIRNSDFRLICATNKDLFKLMSEEKFREDLFYRISSFALEVPPLSKRKNDIILLTRYFIANYCKRNNIEMKDVSPEVLNLFSKYIWNGNVRELENIIEAGIIKCDGSVIELDHISEQINFLSKICGNKRIMIKDKVLTKKMILEARKKCDGNKKRMAKYLGCSLRHLNRKIKDFKIKKD